MSYVTDLLYSIKKSMKSNENKEGMDCNEKIQLNSDKGFSFSQDWNLLHSN